MPKKRKKILRNKVIDELPISRATQPEASKPQLSRAFQTGSFDYRVGPLDDLQKAINAAHKAGGGSIGLQAGTHTITNSLIGVSNIEIIGSNSANTTIQLSGSANLSFAGTDVYSTGTITSVANGVNVTGSGTSWLANVTTDHQLFIGQRWYKIAAVTGNTTLILGEGFAGLGSLNSFPGVSYRAAKVIQGVEIKEVTITGSSATGITFDDCRDVVVEDVIVTSCNKGVVFTNSSQLACNRLILPANTSHGIEFQSSGFGDFDGVSSAGNGGNGLLLNDCRVMPFTFCSMSANTGDGVNITDSDTIVCELEAASNGGQGFELVSGNINIFIQDSLVDSNTGDGIKLTASSDNTKIVIAEITGNGGYGVNIAAASCDNTILSNSVLTSNTSGAVSDSGVGSVYSGNKGVPDKSTEQATNVSGGSLVPGDVVITGGGQKSKVLNPYVDGVVYRHPAGGSSGAETWAAIRDGTGNQEDDTTISGLNVCSIEGSATSNKWRSLWRGIFVFDTSSILDDATINSATFEFYVEGKSDQLGGSHEVALIDGASASNSALAIGDYQNQGTTKQATNLTIAGITTSAYNTWTLNATGLTTINKTGFTKLGLNIEKDRANVEPTWGSLELARIYGQFLGSANEPKLTVIYTVGSSGDEITTTTTAGDDKVFGIVEETIADGATGSIQTLGKTASLKVDGTTDIAVGDYLTPFTTAKIAAKASAGDMAFAVALEAYTTNDSNGVIDARLVSPRKI